MVLMNLKITAVLLLCALSACQKSQSSAAAKSTVANVEKLPPAPLAWTNSFEKPCLIVADRIEIVGPEGLRNHLALRAEAEFHRQHTETTPDGLRQEVSALRPEAAAEIRAYLDRWELVALQSIRVLERPVPCDVRILALGDVLFVDRSTKEQRREQKLEFTGPVRR